MLIQMKKIVRSLALLIVIPLLFVFIFIEFPELWLSWMARSYPIGMELSAFEIALKQNGYSESEIADLRYSDHAMVNLFNEDSSSGAKPYHGSPCYHIPNPASTNLDFFGLAPFSAYYYLVISFDDSNKIRYSGEIKDELETWGCGLPIWW